MSSADEGDSDDSDDSDDWDFKSTSSPSHLEAGPRAKLYDKDLSSNTELNVNDRILKGIANVANSLFIPVLARNAEALPPTGANHGRRLWEKAGKKMKAVGAFGDIVNEARQNCCIQLADLRRQLREGNGQEQVDGKPTFLKTKEEIREIKKNVVEETKNLLFVVKIRPYSETPDRVSEKMKLQSHEGKYKGVNVREAKPCPKNYHVVVSDCYGGLKTFNVSAEIKNWTLGDNSPNLRKYIADNLQTPRAEVETASVPSVTWPDVYFENIKTLESNRTLFRTEGRFKHFDDIHSPGVLSEELFGEVEPLVAASIEADGGDTVIIAYGKRNSGKTYTLHDTQNGATRSIANYIFERDFTVRCKFLDFSIRSEKLKQGSYVYLDTYSYVTPPSDRFPKDKGIAPFDVPDISSKRHPLRNWDAKHEQDGQIYAFKTIQTFDKVYESIIGAKADQEKSLTPTQHSHFVTVIEIVGKGEMHRPANKKIYLIDIFDENEEELKAKLKTIVESNKSNLNEFKENGVMKDLATDTKKLMKGNTATADLVHAIDGRSNQNDTLRKLLEKVVKEGDADVDKGLQTRDDPFKGRLGAYAYGETKESKTTGNQRFAQTLDWVLRSRNGKPTRGLVFTCLDPYDEEGSAETLSLLPWVERKVLDSMFNYVTTEAKTMTEQDVITELKTKQLKATAVIGNGACFFNALKESMPSHADVEQDVPAQTYRDNAVDTILESFDDGTLYEKMQEKLDVFGFDGPDSLKDYLNARVGGNYAEFLKRMKQPEIWAEADFFELYFLLLNVPVILYVKQRKQTAESDENWTRVCVGTCNYDYGAKIAVNVLHMLNAADYHFNALAAQDHVLTDVELQSNETILSDM